MSNVNFNKHKMNLGYCSLKVNAVKINSVPKPGMLNNLFLSAI